MRTTCPMLPAADGDGATLRAARLRAGLTLRELAAELHCCPSVISYWERGLRAVPAWVLARVRRMRPCSVCRPRRTRRKRPRA